MKDTYHRDPALESRRRMEHMNPYTSQRDLVLAKVVAVHPDTGTVDVALDGTHQGGITHSVPVLSWSYGTQTGQSYLPGNIKLASPIPSSQGSYDQPIPSGEQDVWCVIGHLVGRAQRPVCLGFLAPHQSQVHTKDVGYEVKLHESGVYSVTDPNGNVNICLPDGSNIVIGTSSTPINMASQNANWNPQTTTKKFSLTLNIQGDVTINASGKVFLGTADGGGEAIARNGDSVVNGVIQASSSKVFSG